MTADLERVQAAADRLNDQLDDLHDDDASNDDDVTDIRKDAVNQNNHDSVDERCNDYIVEEPSSEYSSVAEDATTITSTSSEINEDVEYGYDNNSTINAEEDFSGRFKGYFQPWVTFRGVHRGERKGEGGAR